MTTLDRPAARLRAFEPSAFVGVLYHEYTLYKRYWYSTTFAAIVEPAIYLFAFGFGFGSFIKFVAGYRYMDFIATGVVATAVLFTAAFAGMFNTFVRRTYQHSYDAILAAPVDIHELVTAEATWIACKAGVYGTAPVLVGMAFGLPPSWGMLTVPLIGFVTGFGFGLFGMWVSAVAASFDHFNYIISAVLTPLFLVAGTFFPVARLGDWAHVAAQINPLYHCVQLVRTAVFGGPPLYSLAHVVALLVFCALMWGLAVHRLSGRLID
ncbi:MAG: ABC transporter permease [Streptosporangiales bacterium]